MPDMSELHDYISGLTGKEVDAAILMLMSKYVSNFNGRVGPTIQPQKGDYDASKITIPGIAIPENLEDLEFGDTSQTLLAQILNVLSSLKNDLDIIKQNGGIYTETVLYGTPTTNLANGTYTLSDSIMNYDSIKVEVHLDTNAWWSGYREYSLQQIIEARKIRTDQSQLMVYDYDNSYVGIAFLTDNIRFVYNRNSRNYVSRIIGVKYNQNLFNEQEET